MPREQVGKNADDSGVWAGSRLLLVDADHLTAWSLREYLRRWFEVEATTTPDAAQAVLDEHPVEAMVLSGSMPVEKRCRLEDRARSRNPAVRCVRMEIDDASDDGAGADQPPVAHITKPFQLSALARLLGVPDTELRR